MASNRINQRHKKALESLHPVFKCRVEQVLNDLKAKGWLPVLVYGYRVYSIN